MANNGIDKKIGLTLAKAESTYGTDPTPTPAANALYCIESTVTPVWETVDKVRYRDTHPAPGVMIGAAWYEWTITLPIAGPAAASPLVEPRSEPLLLASRHAVAETGSPVDTHTYTPSSTSAPGSATLYFYMAPLDGTSNWELIKVTGARCTLAMEGPSGGEGTMTFSGIGLYSPPTNVSKPTGTAFVEPNDSLPPKGHTLTFDSRTDAITAWSFAQNAEVVAKRDQGATYGIGCIECYLGQPTIEHDAELVLTSTYDRHSKLDDTVSAAMSMALNTVGGARWTLAAGEFQFGSFTYDRAEDVMRVGQTLYPRDTAAGSGDDSYSIAVTRP